MNELIDNNILETNKNFRKRIKGTYLFIAFVILDIIIGIISYPYILEGGDAHPVFMSLFWFPFYALCVSIPVVIILFVIANIYDSPDKPLYFNNILPNIMISSQFIPNKRIQYQEQVSIIGHCSYY